MTALIEHIKLRLIKVLLWLPWLPSEQLYRLDEWLVEVTGTRWLAIALCRVLIVFFPFSPWGRYKLGNLHQQARRPALALACYERAIALSPVYLPAYYRAIEMAPQRADLYQGLAAALTHQGKATEAYVFAQLGRAQLGQQSTMSAATGPVAYPIVTQVS